MKIFKGWQGRRPPVQSYSVAFQRQIEADRLQRGIPADLAGFRARFQRNLVGHWKTEPESEMMPVTEWNFLSDGTAVQSNDSIIIGSNEAHFRWRERADFCIELCPAGDDDENAHWFPLHYNFKQKNGFIVLVQLPESADFKFYLTTDYLFFQG